MAGRTRYHAVRIALLSMLRLITVRMLLSRRPVVCEPTCITAHTRRASRIAAQLTSAAWIMGGRPHNFSACNGSGCYQSGGQSRQSFA